MEKQLKCPSLEFLNISGTKGEFSDILYPKFLFPFLFKIQRCPGGVIWYELQRHEEDGSRGVIGESLAVLASHPTQEIVLI